jgi:hypothetical protein
MMKSKHSKAQKDDFAVRVGRALRRSARVARREAKAHGTKLYFWKNGKVVAENP